MKGYRKYICDECKVESRHHWIEKNRASRMRCPACGSSRLVLVTKEAKNEAVVAQRVRIQGHRDMTRTPDELDPKKKVT